MRRIILSIIIVMALPLLAKPNAVYAQQDPYREMMDSTLAKLKELSDFANWPGKTGPVRAGVKLSKDLIPSFQEATEVWKNKSPMLWEIGESQVVKYRYRWRIGSEMDVQVDMTIGQSCDDAHEYLIRRYAYSNFPYMPPRDHPTIVGDISFAGGEEFIQNNIVVEIRAEGGMKEKTREIAEQIDALLLTRPTAPSATQMKPVIERLEIAQNPVKEKSRTSLLVEVRDPQGGEVEYQWRPTGGGVEKDTSGTYSYYAGDIGEQKLTLIVINDSGFSAHAEIGIIVEEDSFFRRSR